MEKETIDFMGEVIDCEKFPNVFKWAQENPDTLKKTIEGMMEKQKFTNVGSAMVMLESDLG